MLRSWCRTQHAGRIHKISAGLRPAAPSLSRDAGEDSHGRAQGGAPRVEQAWPESRPRPPRASDGRGGQAAQLAPGMDYGVQPGLRRGRTRTPEE